MNAGARVPTELMNTGDEVDAHQVAKSREEFTRRRAEAEAAGRGLTADLAAAPEMGDDKTLERAIASGAVTVIVPERRVPAHQIFGPESPLAKGTFVHADGSPCPPGKEAYGRIGDIIHPTIGRLINRIIPFEDTAA